MSEPTHTPGEHMSAFQVDEWNAGDASPEAHQKHAAHLAQCDTCRARVDEAARRAQAFLSEVPDLNALQARATRAQARSAAPRRTRARFAAVAGGLALAAAVLLMLRLPPEPITRDKGAEHLIAYVKRGDRVTRVTYGEAVRAGDRLRFGYSSDRDGFLAVFGWDGRVLQRYHPSAGEVTVAAPAGRDVALDFAVELDATPGTERFYGVFCHSATLLETVRSALASAAPAPAGCHVDVLDLRKESAR
jgi:hypothetical protein